MMDIYNLRNLILDGLCTDGAHHKQWYLEKIAEELKIDINSEIEGYEKGIAP